MNQTETFTMTVCEIRAIKPILLSYCNAKTHPNITFDRNLNAKTLTATIIKYTLKHTECCKTLCANLGIRQINVEQFQMFRNPLHSIFKQ